MGLHYSGGLGMLYEKESSLLISKINYQMIETDATIYTKSRWWGDRFYRFNGRGRLSGFKKA